MRTIKRLAITALLAAPWLALLGGLAVVGGTLPAWALWVLAFVVLLSAAFLAALARVARGGR